MQRDVMKDALGLPQNGCHAILRILAGANRVCEGSLSNAAPRTLQKVIPAKKRGTRWAPPYSLTAAIYLRPDQATTGTAGPVPPPGVCLRSLAYFGARGALPAMMSFT